MEAFRRLIRGWLGKVLLVLFLTPLALVGIEGYFMGGGEDKAAIQVNKTKISPAVLNAAVDNQHKQLLAQVQDDASLLNDAAIKKSVIDGLIARTLLLQQAKKLGFELSDQQIAQLIRQEPSFQEDGKYSEGLFQAYLKNSGASMAQLLNEVREQVALRQLAGGITDTGLVSQQDITRLAILKTEKRDVHIASLPLSGFGKDIQITTQQITDYYNKNKDQYLVPDNVDVEYVVLNSASLAPQLQITDADIQAQYQALQSTSASAEERHIQHILIEVTDKITDAQAKQQIEKVAARLKAGEDFAKVAREVSQDAGSAENNGDLGFLAKGSFPGAFDDTAFGLAVNQVSKPVRSDAGYHLIKVSEIRKDDVASLESLRPQLEAQVRQNKLDELYSEVINHLNEMAVETDSVQELARVQHLTVNSAKMITKTSNTPPFNNANVKAALFNEDVVQGDRKISTGLEIEPGTTMWVKVNNYHPERAQSLAEATAQIKQTLEQQARLAKAKAKAKAIVDGLKTKAPQQVQQDNQVVFQGIGEVSRMSGAPLELERTIFRMAKPQDGKWSADYYQQGDNLIVVAVSKVVAGNPDSLQAEERQQLSSTLARLRGQQELADYVQYLRSKAKIKIHDADTKK
ncbi:SurA N-terminal domain-containing protein [Alkanindiges sp. WGS2144]|uniref:SurA N-terminal domain-containing protein n=1 Tax=Alkanindiges sp. WGS2144 TaxID=3366808 RepID=UPI0037520B17